MDAQEQLFGLVAIAKEQQKAVKTALDGIAAERAAFAKERKAANEAQEAVSGAVVASVQKALAGASEVASAAFAEASKPVLGRLSSVVKTAGEVETTLSDAVTGFGWRWGLLVWICAAAGILVVFLAAWLAIEWQRHEIGELQAEKLALRAEVAQLQANANAWAKRGGRAKLETCGERGRLCVRVDLSGGYGKNGDYYVLRGY